MRYRRAKAWRPPTRGRRTPGFRRQPKRSATSRHRQRTHLPWSPRIGALRDNICRTAQRRPRDHREIYGLVHCRSSQDVLPLRRKRVHGSLAGAIPTVARTRTTPTNAEFRFPTVAAPPGAPRTGHGGKLKVGTGQRHTEGVPFRVPETEYFRSVLSAGGAS